MIGAPRSTIWYRVKSNETHALVKPDRSIVLQINRLNFIEEIGYPRRVVLPPLFNIEVDSAHEVILEKMAILASVGRGRFYGVVKPHSLGYMCGLCFSPSVLLTPRFQDQNQVRGVIHEMTLGECWALGLPTDPPRYDGPRPTRFERPPVI